jgi:hypothetical protein
VLSAGLSVDMQSPRENRPETRRRQRRRAAGRGWQAGKDAILAPEPRLPREGSLAGVRAKQWESAKLAKGVDGGGAVPQRQMAAPDMHTSRHLLDLFKVVDRRTRTE